MEASVTTQFVILTLHPDKGRIMMNNIHFRYSLIGAVLMDFLDLEEISLSNKRLVPSFRKNSDLIHDMFAEKIKRSSKPRRVSHWVRSLSGKSRKQSMMIGLIKASLSYHLLAKEKDERRVLRRKCNEFM
jgi:hypothetical protein